MDEYEYVTYGVCYERAEEKQSKDITVYVSFGGLLMRLKTLNSNPNNLLQDLNVDDRVYCMMRHRKG